MELQQGLWEKLVYLFDKNDSQIPIVLLTSQGFEMMFLDLHGRVIVDKVLVCVVCSNNLEYYGPLLRLTKNI